LLSTGAEAAQGSEQGKSTKRAQRPDIQHSYTPDERFLQRTLDAGH
jgi:hypothetical protein